MDSRVYDLGTGRWSDDMPTGNQGFISFARLVEQLQKAGELRDYERVTHLEIERRGIAYRVADVEAVE